MEFPSMTVCALFWWLMEMTFLTHRAHRYELAWPVLRLLRWFLDTKPSPQRAYLYEFLVTQSTKILIVSKMTLHVSLYIVPGDERFTTQNTLIWFLHMVAEFESNVKQSTMTWRLVGITDRRKFNCPQYDSSCASVYFSRIWIIYHTEHINMNSSQYEALCVSSCGHWIWIHCHTEHNFSCMAFHVHWLVIHECPSEFFINQKLSFPPKGLQPDKELPIVWLVGSLIYSIWTHRTSGRVTLAKNRAN